MTATVSEEEIAAACKAMKNAGVVDYVFDETATAIARAVLEAAATIRSEARAAGRTLVERAVLHTANAAWEIGSGDATGEVCRAIEDLSDEPNTCTKIVSAVLSDEIARYAYSVFRGGYHGNICPAPHWDDAPTWIRDLVKVAVLSGALHADAILAAAPRPAPDETRER